MKVKLMILSLIVTILAVFLLWGPIMSQVEQPKYSVLEASKSIQIRSYTPMIVARVTVTGDRQSAMRKGFKQLANYIFGNNTQRAKISMTGPVSAHQNEKIPMTAPVTQYGKQDVWVVQFMMPAGYTLKSLPRPNNPHVTLHTVLEKHFVVIRFSGRNRSSNLEKHLHALEGYMVQRHLKAVSEPIYAFYNPPWTLPFLRRNEILIEIKTGVGS